MADYPWEEGYNDAQDEYPWEAAARKHEEKKQAEKDAAKAATAEAVADEQKKRERIAQAEQTYNTFLGSVLSNILDNYDNPSYNLKLYMIPPGGKAVSTNPQTGEPERSTQSDDSDSQDARSDIPTTGSMNDQGTGYLNNCVRAEPENTVVLAQTGVTEVGIDNLEITTVPGPNTTETSLVTFTITQPNAADFPDQIVKGRQFLGAPPDAGDCPLFLEINFVGYDESDVEADLNVEKTVGNFDVEKGGTPRNILGPLIFPLIFKNFTMNITAGGSVYNFTTVMQNDIAGADNFFRLQKAMTIKGSTIGEMLIDLKKQINNWNAKKTGEESEKDDPHYRVDFGFIMPNRVQGLDIEDQSLDIQEAEKVSRVIGQSHDKKNAHKDALMADRQSEADAQARDDFRKKYNLPGSNDTKVNPVNPSDLTAEEIIEQYNSQNNILTPRNVKVTDEGIVTEYNPIPKKNKIQVNPDADMKVSLDLDVGMGLDEVLGIILSMNKEFMQKATRTKDINDPTNKEVDATKQVMWYTFDSYVEYGRYSESRKEYQKIAIYIPRTFVSDKSDIGIYQWEIDAANNLSKADATTRLQQMNVRKAYEYIFTGRNDQIKNIDITYNEGLSLLVPTDRGTLGDISLNAASILDSNPVPKNEQLEDTGLEKLTKEKSKGGFFDQLKDLIKKGNDIAENIGRAANLSSEEIKDLVNNASGKAATKLQGILSDQTNAQAVADQLTKNRKSSPQSGSQTQTDEFTPSQSGFVYGGDLIGDNKYTEELANNVKKSTNLPLRTNAQAKDGSSNAGTFKGIKNNLFTYLYSQNVSVDFMNRLEMTIRGDPWWLGKKPQPPGDNKQIPGISADKSASTSGDDLICSTNDRVNYLLFSLNSPRLFDPNVENEDKNTGMWMYEGDGTSYFMSGVYQVRDVIHRFNNGVYDCDITCVKEVAIDLSNVERVNGSFFYADTDRKGFTARAQDGTLTESEIENNYKQDEVAYINGMLTTATGSDFDSKFGMPSALKDASDFEKNDWRVRKLLKQGKITPEQYQAWYQTTKLKTQKAEERRARDKANTQSNAEDLGVTINGSDDSG